ncbi:MAG: XRE family transcriptional regulator [Sedimenticola sp.]|uniref:Helix-turn-helix transcriptional regulator n=2 Tax=Sedimenticola TaxID=349742 RepID=A0A558CXC5_9GAMM|nr:helix-turn-helix transcriptional regulator [Sedimenticola selenatireducens]PLY12909.1 MAG: XRE family transcriptional regulator [Sedimenticola sp.]TVO69711.1 helix-turn-helix transcriptional regulator [Sedimenticola selenatireducens]TVT53383.1 MAG: helix-turn-helix transcriptional regulator [Sedimenticola thiotaurini]TVT62221.1 MAG: helix-turn-helix transcriptional regulator [Sedimenticola selenatireducens]
MSDKEQQAAIISSNIKRLRSSVNWTQAKLAEEAGITGAALSKIEQGEKRIPTIVVLRKIASALKVSVHEITGERVDTVSPEDEETRAFHRKWGMLEELSEDDQEMLIGMAGRLRKMTKE